MGGTMLLMYMAFMGCDPVLVLYGGMPAIDGGPLLDVYMGCMPAPELLMYPAPIMLLGGTAVLRGWPPCMGDDIGMGV